VGAGFDQFCAFADRKARVSRGITAR